MSTGRPLQQEHIEEVLERATSAWPRGGTVEEIWEVMRSALNQQMNCLVMKKGDNQTGSRSQRMSLGLSSSRGIIHMTDGWLRKGRGSDEI